MTTIGSHAAKTHLARLLDEVEAGNSVTITRHGREVARLVPPSRQSAQPDEIIAALRSERREVRRGRSSVRKMIAEGAH
jgi:prevent-host-death family protein